MDLTCWDHFTYLEGLPDEEQQFVTEGPTGVMWFASMNTVSRFDGGQFEIFPAEAVFENTEILGFTQPPKLRRIHTIKAQPDGTLWAGIGTNAYLWPSEEAFIMKLKDREWEVIHTINGTPMDYLMPLWVSPEGALWVSARHKDGDRWVNEVCGYLAGAWDCYPLEGDGDLDPATAITGGSDGEIWIGTLDGRVIHFQNGKQTVFDLNDYLAGTEIKRAYSILKLVYNPQARSLWALSKQAFLAHYSQGAWTFVSQGQFTNNAQIGVLSTIELDSQNQLWVGSYLSGFWSFSEESWGDLVNDPEGDLSPYKIKKGGDVDSSQTKTEAECTSPQLPFGSKLSFDYYRSHTGDMWVINGYVWRYKSGKGGSSPAAEEAPYLSLSPGQYIVTSDAEDINVFSSDGQFQHVLLKGTPVIAGDVTRDGKWLTFRASDGLSVYDVINNRLTQIIRDSCWDPVWNPNQGNQEVAAVCMKGIRLFSVKDRKRIVQVEPLGPEFSPMTLSWSPDGRWIAFSGIGWNENPDKERAYFMDATCLTNGQGCETTVHGPFLAGGDGTNWPLQISWAPDSRQFAVVSHSQSSIFLVDIVNQTEKMLVKDDSYFIEGIEWSPDGKWLAFINPASDPDLLEPDFALSLLPVSGGEPVVLAKDAGYIIGWFTVPTPFQVGEAWVITPAADKLDLRTAPSWSGRAVQRLEPGDGITILEGPVEAEGSRWWQVRSNKGMEGWVVDIPEWFEAK